MDFDLDEAFVDDSSTWVDFSPLYDNVEIDSGDEERWRETAMASASLSSASESVSPHVEVFALSASCGDNADTVALSSSFSSLTPVASESVAATHSSLGVVWSAPSGQQCNPDDPEFVRRCVVLVSLSVVLGIVGKLLPDATKEMNLFRELRVHLGPLLFVVLGGNLK